GLDDNGRKIVKNYLEFQLVTRWEADETKIAIAKKDLLNSLTPLAEKESKGYAQALDMIFDILKAQAGSKGKKVIPFNAVLMAGELNSVQKRGVKPVPYAKAVPFLKEIAASEDIALQIAALKGLARHAECGLKSASEREAFAKIFARFAFAPLAKGDANEAPEIQWMRLLSLEALGNVGYAGPKGEIAKQLFESANRQNKSLDSQYFRRDMERRIISAASFCKLRLSEDTLKAVGKKPDDISLAFAKLFLVCMKYEYEFDYYLQEGVEGEVEKNPRMRQMARTMGQEEESYQIRLWKQRTKAISGTFAWIFNSSDSALRQMHDGNTNYLKIARSIRSISEMYDRAGLPKKGRSASENPDDPNYVPVEVSSVSTDDSRLSLYSMQKDMRNALRDLAEILDITIDIPAKRRMDSTY
ncbi:MAG: hypothetical protein Q4D17_08340, partial [Planctomycetia bacterium]|nr:hypothetical protein [Planctomycetia bacterium]